MTKAEDWVEQSIPKWVSWKNEMNQNHRVVGRFGWEPGVSWLLCGYSSSWHKYLHWMTSKGPPRVNFPSQEWKFWPGFVEGLPVYAEASGTRCTCQLMMGALKVPPCQLVCWLIAGRLPNSYKLRRSHFPKLKRKAYIYSQFALNSYNKMCRTSCELIS